MTYANPAPTAAFGRQHLVRFGALGTVGRFVSVDAVHYPRATRVIVRTGRGLEVGEVLSEPGPGEEPSPDGSIIRGITVEDDLLLARLERNRAEALSACSQRIAQLGLSTVLVDVEHLFDGQSLVFYFLGEVPPELAAMTHELAELYESQVQFRAFADAVEQGCGPGCGTETAAGCKTCVAGCAVASACSTRR